jgi:hypothetical protein
MINSNIILISTSRSSEWCLSLSPSGFPAIILYAFLVYPMYATFHANLTLVYLITLLIFGETYKLRSPSTQILKELDQKFGTTNSMEQSFLRS